jgi:RNA-directed DNA polymerase
VFNLVHHRHTLITAWERVKGNKGAGTAGSDGLTVARIATEIGVGPFLDDLRSQLKEGTYRPESVRERKIRKPGGSGKVRRLGVHRQRIRWWRLFEVPPLPQLPPDKETAYVMLDRA